MIHLQREELTEQIGKLNIKIAKANKELDELELKYKKKKLGIRKYKNESVGLQLELQELELENWKEIYFLTITRKELILDKNIKIIYNKLENIKLNQGYIDLSNSSIQNKNDLVDVCNIFRDPRYETFRIFYMRDNKIVGQEAMTSKIPDGVFIFNEKYEIFLLQLVKILTIIYAIH